MTEILPSPQYKQALVIEHAERYNIRTLIETGTYLGDMITAAREHFDCIYSIELSEALYGRAITRFWGDTRLKLYHGDSAKLLPEILATIHSPCLFWLDAHASGGDTVRGIKVTPILEELAAILTHHIANHVVLIDDARGFVGANDYPMLDEVQVLARRNRPNLSFSVENDIIRLCPCAPV